MTYRKLFTHSGSIYMVAVLTPINLHYFTLLL